MHFVVRRSDIFTLDQLWFYFSAKGASLLHGLLESTIDSALFETSHSLSFELVRRWTLTLLDR